MNIFLYLPFIFKAFETIALFVFALATLIALKNIFAEEEISIYELIKEIIYSSLTFVIFFSLSDHTIPFNQVVKAFIIGVSAGFMISFVVKLFFQKTLWLVKGSFIFLLIWAITLIASEISEQIFESIEWWWIVLAVFSISMMIGETVNIALRQNIFKLRGQKK